MRGVALAVLLYVAFFGGWSVLQQWLGQANTFDTGIHDQALWLVARGENPFMTSRGLQIHADHFSAIAWALAPLYWIWDSPQALVWLQAVWLGSGAIPVYLLASREVRSPGLAQALAMLYLCQPCLHWSNLFDVHFSTLMTTPLLWALVALQRRDARLYLAALVTTLACSETAAVTLVGMLALAWKRAGWRWSLATLALAITGLGVSLGVVRWHNLGQPTQYTLLYSHYGKNSREVAQTVLTHPLDTLQRLDNRVNRHYFHSLFRPLVYLPLLAPWELSPVAPVLAGNLLSWRESQHTIKFHYTAAVVPFMMWAACCAAGRLEQRLGARFCVWLLVSAALFGFRYGPMEPREWTHPDSRCPEAIDDLHRLIPPQASLSAPNRLGGVLSHRRDAYLFPNPMFQAAWGGRRQALVDQTVMGVQVPEPGVWRRALERVQLDYVVTAPGLEAEFPLNRPDRYYLEEELCASPDWKLFYCANQIAIFSRNGGKAYPSSVLPAANWSGYQFKPGPLQWPARQ